MCEYCKECGRGLKRIDIAATMKFINRAATEYMCISCIAKHYQVTEDQINIMIEHFRRQGCSLFN